MSHDFPPCKCHLPPTIVTPVISLVIQFQIAFFHKLIQSLVFEIRMLPFDMKAETIIRHNNSTIVTTHRPNFPKVVTKFLHFYDNKLDLKQNGIHTY